MVALLVPGAASAQPNATEPGTVPPSWWSDAWRGSPQQPTPQPGLQAEGITPGDLRAPGQPASTSAWSRWPRQGWNSSPTPLHAFDQDAREIAAAALDFLHQFAPGERRIEVTVRHNLATVEAFEGGRMVRRSQAFAGLPGEPTPVGEFRVQDRVNLLRTTIWQARSGHEWDLPYFVQFANDYGFHGPMLHPHTGEPSLTFTAGCLALGFEDARWLFEWAAPGTPIRILALPA